jgi:hypothetical protein
MQFCTFAKGANSRSVANIEDSVRMSRRAILKQLLPTWKFKESTLLKIFFAVLLINICGQKDAGFVEVL